MGQQVVNSAGGDFMSYKIITLLILAFLPVIEPSFGQSPVQDRQKPSDQKQEITLTSNLVSITVTVNDRLGRSVTGMSKDNFEIYDDDVKQTIAIFSDDDAPVSIGIVYDVSGSMGDLTTQTFLTLKQFFDTSHEEDEFFIVAFNNKPKLVQDFTSSPNEILNRVIYVKAGGATALFDATYLAINKVQQGRHQKRALLILSDGEENNSRYSGKELNNLLKESDVLIYTIGMSDLMAGAGTLNRLAGMSGGQAYFPMDYSESDDIYKRIALQLRHQYVIGFYPTDTEAGMKWHRLKIRVKAPKALGRLSLSYKKGYRSFR